MTTNAKMILLLGGVLLGAIALQASLPGPGRSHTAVPQRGPIVSGMPAELPWDDEPAGAPPTTAAAPSPNPAAAAPAPDAPGVPASEPAASPPAEGIGTLVAVMRYDGEPPALPPLALDASVLGGCHAHGGAPMDMTDRSLLVAPDGGIANVLVLLEPKSGAAALAVPAEPIVLDQSGCRYEPHVLVVPVGAQVAYRNSDPISHNVHTYSKKNGAFNTTVSTGGSETRKLALDEQFEVRCDIHPWMSAWVVAVEDYHGLSDAEGRVRIENVPAGTYKASWWHETLGKGRLDDVTILADAETTPEWGALKAKRGR